MLRVRRWNDSARTVDQFDLASAEPATDELKSRPDILWIDLCSPSDAELALVFDELMPVHALTREDLTRPSRDPEGRPHLPKIEEFDRYLFVIVNPLTAHAADPEDSGPLTTQLGAILTESRLITVRYGPVAAVESVSGHLDRHPTQMARGPDYVFHLILDALVDEYAPLLDALAERLDDLEEQVFVPGERLTLPRLLRLKRRLTGMRKTLAFEREILARLSRGEFELIDERETAYYRNVYDHIVRFSELTEGGREMLSDLMQTHLSVVSNRLNEVMKALTMVSTVVLPMSIVTGIYGMNFQHMPEIEWRWGYPFALALLGLAGFLPLAWFHWKRWV
jgi:magnesium transporter